MRTSAGYYGCAFSPRRTSVACPVGENKAVFSGYSKATVFPESPQPAWTARSEQALGPTSCNVASVTSGNVICRWTGPSKYRARSCDQVLLETTVTTTTTLPSLPACRPRFFPATRSALLYVLNYNPFLTCRCFKNGQEQMRYECSKLAVSRTQEKKKETHLYCCGRGLHALARYLLNMLIKPGRQAYHTYRVVHGPAV